VDVLERVRDFDGFRADFIRCTDDVTGFHAPLLLLQNKVGKFFPDRNNFTFRCD
jgi:hypothetical protein